MQSGVKVPVVHAHVFSQFLKSLVDLKTDLSWLKHRSDLAAGETERLKDQFTPQGTAAKGWELLTCCIASDSWKGVIMRQLFLSPPTTKHEMQARLQQLFQPQALPVRIIRAQKCFTVFMGI